MGEVKTADFSQEIPGNALWYYIDDSVKLIVAKNVKLVEVS